MIDSREQEKLTLLSVKSTMEYTLSMLQLVQHMGKAWRVENVLDLLIQAHAENVASYEKQLKELEDDVPNP